MTKKPHAETHQNGVSSYEHISDVRRRDARRRFRNRPAALAFVLSRRSVRRDISHRNSGSKCYWVARNRVLRRPHRPSRKHPRLAFGAAVRDHWRSWWIHHIFRVQPSNLQPAGGWRMVSRHAQHCVVAGRLPFIDVGGNGYRHRFKSKMIMHNNSSTAERNLAGAEQCVLLRIFIDDWNKHEHMPPMLLQPIAAKRLWKNRAPLPSKRLYSR